MQSTNGSSDISEISLYLKEYLLMITSNFKLFKMKILIFGASGSGTTTLGRELAKTTDFTHLDADNYYWRPTPTPFQEKMPLAERSQMLTNDFEKYENVILTGSMVSWGEQWERAFDLVIFIYLNSKVRIDRLKKREVERYGDKLLTDEQVQRSSDEFIQWAKKYDDPDFTGRSLKVHNDWIKKLSCPVFRIGGEMDLNSKIEKVVQELKKLQVV